MLAAQLNELGLSRQQSQSQPEAPPRNNRQSSAALGGGGGGGASGGIGKPAAAAPPGAINNHQLQQQQHINPLDPLESSDTDSEPEETNERGRNDGTLLASDPPKPL